MIFKNRFYILYLLSGLFFYVNATRRNSRWADNDGLSTSSEESSIEANNSSEKFLLQIVRLLNAGKKAMGLKTENPIEFMAIADHNETARTNKMKSQQSGVEDAIAKSTNLVTEPDEEKYLVISGDDKGVHVDKEKVAKLSNDGVNNMTDVQDIFEMVLSKYATSGNGSDTKVEEIKIVERNHFIPSSKIDFPSILQKQLRSKREVAISPKSAPQSKRLKWKLLEPTKMHKDEIRVNEKSPDGLVLPLFWSALTMLIFMLSISLLIYRYKTKIRHIGYKPIPSLDTETSVENQQISEDEIRITEDSDQDFESIDLDWQDECGNWQTDTSTCSPVDTSIYLNTSM